MHNSFLLTIHFCNTLVTGSSSVEYVKKKVDVLGQCEGVSDQLEANLQNRSKRLKELALYYFPSAYACTVEYDQR